MGKWSIKKQAIVMAISGFLLWMISAVVIYSAWRDDQRIFKVGAYSASGYLISFADQLGNEMGEARASVQTVQDYLATTTSKAEPEHVLMKSIFENLQLLSRDGKAIDRHCNELVENLEEESGLSSWLSRDDRIFLMEWGSKCSSKLTGLVESTVAISEKVQESDRAAAMVMLSEAWISSELASLDQEASQLVQRAINNSSKMDKKESSNRLLSALIISGILYCLAMLGFFILLGRLSRVFRFATKSVEHADRKSLADQERHVNIPSQFKHLSEEATEFLRALSKHSTKNEKMIRNLSSHGANLASILSSVPVPVVLLNNQLNVKFSNEEFKEVYGDSQDHFLTMQDEFWNFPEMKEYLSDVILMNAQPQVEVLKKHFADSSENKYFKVFLRKLELNVSSDSDGELFLLCLQDVSLEKIHEIELTHERKRSQRADKAKSRFLANMSHEIRTPLNAITGMVDLMKDTKLSEEQGKYVEVFERASVALLKVINDVLDISKLEADEFTLVPSVFSLPETLEATADLMAGEAFKKDLEFAYHIDPKVPEMVKSDEARFSRVVINLLSNAIKFTHQGEVRMVCSVEGEPTEFGANLEIRVSDTGVGIYPDSLDRIFESFKQDEHQGFEKIQGTGLGLSISNAIVKAMGGKLTVESTVGKGSVFRILMPIEVVEARPHYLPAVEKLISGKNVCIVDDNDTNRFVLESLLLPFGLEERSLYSGSVECLKSLEESFSKGALDIPEVYLLDYRMPGKLGDELLLAIEALRLKNCPERVFRYALLSSEIALKFSNGIRDLETQGHFSLVYKPLGRRKVETFLKKIMGDTTPQSRAASDELSRSSAVLEKKYSLLLAEDSEDSRAVFSAFLKNSEFSVEFAAKGDVALMMLEKWNYDLVLLDLDMPALSGFEVAAQFTEYLQRTGAPKPPIVALTAFVLDRDLKTRLEKHFDGAISKPVRKEFFMEEIRNYLMKQVPLIPNELQSQYIKTKVELLPHLWDLFHEDDWPQLGREAHKIKGSAGSYGLDHLGEVAAILEKAALSEDASSAKSALGKIESLLKV